MKGYYTKAGYKGYMPGYGYVLFATEKEYEEEYAELIAEMESEMSPKYIAGLVVKAICVLPLLWAAISMMILICPN